MESVFNEGSGFETYNFIKKWPQQKYFTVNFAKFKNIYFVKYL